MGFDYHRFGGTAAAQLRRNAGRLDRSIAEGLRPPPRMDVSEWAQRYRRFPDDDAFPGPWRHETAPELVEIMDALSPHDPCEEASIIKCAQSGGSASAENWIGYISDLRPGPVLFVQATLKAAWDWAAEKFWPMVEATPRLNPERGGTIKALGLPDGDGSTKHKIRFARSSGYVLLAGANSAAGLRQRTVRYAIEDDLDQFPDDLDGQGSPEAMVDQRLKVWRRQGLSKRLKISTPTIRGASKIELAFAASDKRHFHLKCPHCGSRFKPEWQDIIWPDGRSEEAHLVPPCCGAVVEHWQKAAMKLPDGWLSEEIDGAKPPRHMNEEDFQGWRARMPASRKRGFHLTGIISSFQTWADMATGFLAAQGDLNKLKTWTNLVLGWVFELKGGVPDYEKLRELKEQDWGRRQMPFGPVATTLGVDVQGDGLYLELVGWGPNAENWSMDARFLPGATDVKGEGAWRDLDAYARTKIVYPGGREFAIDQICVDAGYHTEAAEAFCRAHPNRLPVFGRAGWTLPILGRGENLRYDKQGSRAGKASKRAEDKAFIVGTYGVKLSWYGWLRETIKASAEAIAAGDGGTRPRGFCHFNRDAPDEYFEQVTAETVLTRMVNGTPRREWQVMAGRQNHWLDCRVYNIAAAEKLLLDTLGEADWANLRAERYAPKDGTQGDLLAGPIAAPAPAKTKQAPTPAPSADRGAEEWIDDRNDWID
ncbi:MAG: phage terminase large subunit family protein [Allosphingosinicella sp.]|uniref:phage terminase large subunit family protein n=1 Tax=Allosphingosinicella sp. TaxID=2823234 RepID=UPI0039219A6C